MFTTPGHELSTLTRRQEFYAGMRAILPLIVGAIPFGIIFGAVAVTGGLSTPAVAAMSALVFAGSAQFVAAGMVASGASVWVIVGATFVVNLRHVLYATSLAPYMRHLSQRWLLPLGLWLTDESFVVATRRYTNADRSPYKHWFHLGAQLTMYVNWQACTVLGVWAGRSIPNPRAWGLDFALPVTFIGMLVPMLMGRALVACCLTAGITALLMHGLPHQLGLVFGALFGVAAGLLMERGRYQADQPANTPMHNTVQYDRSAQYGVDEPAASADTTHMRETRQ